MRFVVVGAGAVGGVVGGLLHRSGAEVVLVARGAHLERIQRQGLRLLTFQGDSDEQVTAAGSVADIEWRDDDVALLAAKSDATHGLLIELAAVAPPTIALVCLQNGVANEPTALRWFENVYGITVMAPTTHLDPGVVEANCGPVAAILDIGRYPRGVDDGARAIAQAFERASIISVPRPDIMRWKHRKLIGNLGNAVNAACSAGEAADELLRLVRAEGEGALAAAGIDVATPEQDRERRGDILQRYPREGRRRGGSSSWQSLARGTGAIETDFLNGEIVRLGREIGFPAPANELVRRTVVRMAAERAEPQSIDAATLLTGLRGHDSAGVASA
jgi:2-dehydropantoate 2-reductase